MTFFSLQDLNKKIRKLLCTYNDLLFQRKAASRKELFQSVERQYLKPLPSGKYQLKDYVRAKVQKIGYVYFSPDKSYYTAPYRYIGKSTLIHYTRSTVEIYHYHERIAIHPRNPSMGRYNTIQDHLSSTHKGYSDWSPEYFQNKAAKHGPDVEACVKALFTNCDYPETAYKRAMGIIQLHPLYGSERLNNACRRAVYGKAISYTRIKNILEKRLESDPLETQKEHTNKSHIPAHANIRGAQAFK